MLFSLFFFLFSSFAHATPCADGWESPSTGRGTCSHHGGIARGGYYVPPSRIQTPKYLYQDSDVTYEINEGVKTFKVFTGTANTQNGDTSHFDYTCEMYRGKPMVSVGLLVAPGQFKYTNVIQNIDVFILNASGAVTNNIGGWEVHYYGGSLFLFKTTIGENKFTAEELSSIINSSDILISVHTPLDTHNFFIAMDRMKEKTSEALQRCIVN